MELSIVICVYNTPCELFDATLESIRKSTLLPSGNGRVKGISHEILVIDDGSELDYSALVEKYSLRYVKTENRGIFLARLLGVELAEGRYIVFVDSDDTVTFNYHRPMLEEAVISGCDIVMNDWAFHTERSRYCCLSDETISREIREEGDSVLFRFTKGEGRLHSYYVLWNKLYSAPLLKAAAAMAAKAAEPFGKLSYGEDALINFFAYKMASGLRNIHTGYYFYRIHSSQTVSVTSEEKLLYQIRCMSFVLSTMEENIGRDNLFGKEIYDSIRGWAGLMSRTHYSYALSRGYTELYPIIKEKYRVEKLRRSTRRDASGYGKNHLLGDNFEAVDEALLGAYLSDSTATLSVVGNDPYVKENISYLRSRGVGLEIGKGGTRVPKMHIKFKNRIIMSAPVYKLGMLLFPKGSRIRALLKKKL